MSKPPRRPISGLPDRDTLLRFLHEAGEADKSDLARAFGLKGEDRRALREMLRELEAEGKLGKRGRKGFSEAGALPPVGVADVVERDVDGDFYVRLVEASPDAPMAVLVPDNTGKMGAAPGLSARVLGTDQANDLALLKVDRLPEGIPVAPLGDSDTVQVGDVVIAIGSPFGLSGTVTQGIVSAVNRSWNPPGDRLRTGLIQTDAPINPGNSGGPLFNAQGEVIGIATMIESPIRGNVGIGFAVPSNTVKRVLPRLQSGEELQPAWLGISGTDLDAATAQRFGLSVQKGVIVLEVVPDSPAARAGLRPAEVRGNDIAALGDVIVALDGQPVEGMQDLAARIGAHQPGETVELTVLRDGQQETVRVTLGSWPQQG